MAELVPAHINYQAEGPSNEEEAGSWRLSYKNSNE